MLPLPIFASRQFAAANLVTFAVYAALGGVFFLLVAAAAGRGRLRPLAAGAALLPITRDAAAVRARRAPGRSASARACR